MDAPETNAADSAGVAAPGPQPAGLPPLRGISHLTFLVRDLERMATFLCQGLGGSEVYDSGERLHSLSREKFFLLGGVWIAAMQGEPPAERRYQHVAFAVDPAALPLYRQRLEALGVEFLPARSRIQGEGESLYFHDFDNHLFELHAGNLEQRLHHYALADHLCKTSSSGESTP